MEIRSTSNSTDAGWVKPYFTRPSGEKCFAPDEPCHYFDIAKFNADKDKVGEEGKVSLCGRWGFPEGARVEYEEKGPTCWICMKMVLARNNPHVSLVKIGRMDSDEFGNRRAQ